jgi:hypothetical protein
MRGKQWRCFCGNRTRKDQCPKCQRPRPKEKKARLHDFGTVAPNPELERLRESFEWSAENLAVAPDDITIVEITERAARNYLTSLERKPTAESADKTPGHIWRADFLENRQKVLDELKRKIQAIEIMREQADDES